MEKILIIFILLGLGPFVYGAEETNRQDLARLEQETKQKEAELQKYKQKENLLQKEVQNLSKRGQQTEQLAKKLIKDIETLKGKASSTAEQKVQLEQTRDLWNALLATEANYYTLENSLNNSFYDTIQLEKLLIIKSLLISHSNFVSQLENKKELSLKELQEIEKENKNLERKHQNALSQKETLAKNYEQKKQDLQTTHQLYEQRKQELKELKESAKQLQKLLQKAEDTRKQQNKAMGQKASNAAINIAQNSLPWPIKGKIISKFGKEYQEQLKTWIFRDGIKIAAKEGQGVAAVADGNVIFAGQFRSYGNVVILDHGEGFFTIYGFLSKILAQQGQKVTEGQSIGLIGQDTQGPGMGSNQSALYFEIRKGTTAQDPEIWLE
ncbi:MAG: peptidoglycan DD-metalloendopeptidase family protein [Elusimicrobiaceae bacterium]|nr:peptidoglycan DD-metalloendopeptidase family protein [Elusimicrobiaceae bacterium]